MTDPAWTYRFRAHVTHVVDGDTLVAAADLGLRVTHELIIRLAGCNAAEKATPEGQSAIAYVNKWLGLHQDPDGWFAITTHQAPGDKYGRWLADVTSLDGSANLVADLIAAGFAVVWNGHGPKPVPGAAA